MTTETTNRMDLVFRKLKAEERTALIPFLTVGDPDLETTLAIIAELEAAGADILELGVPYSDPLADGPVIQRASARALRGGSPAYLYGDRVKSSSSRKQPALYFVFLLQSYPANGVGYIFRRTECS